VEEAPDHEVAAAEEEILDQATAARTIDELKAELTTLGACPKKLRVSHQELPLGR
jgi:hypothetical protein